MNIEDRYHQCVEEILAIPRYKKKTDQNAIAKLLEELENPQDSFQIIHVAGTNGKGSICATIEQIGRDLGYQIGLFTSPHLLDIRERFMVDHQLMSYKDFVACYETVKTAKERCYVAGQAPYTFFETIFAMGMLYFQWQNVAYAIVEAGMGGRSDTTNVVRPIATVIASVGLDHTAVLGETLEAIAREKAGIMKSGAVAVVARQDQSILPIFKDFSKSIGIDCHFVQEREVRILKNELEGIDFSVICEYDKKGQNASDSSGFLSENQIDSCVFHANLVGDYQVDNIIAALEVAIHIWSCNPKTLVDAVAKVHWPGRMERVAPKVYVDGAHNDHAIVGFVRNVKQYVSGKDLTILYAVANDKDDASMLQELLTLEPCELVITELNNSRKTDCAEVAAIAKAIINQNGYQTKVVVSDGSIKEAVELARSYEKTVFCVGSLYLVSDIKAYFGQS